jgi:hypothetical protein
MGRLPTRMMATPGLDCLVLSPDDGRGAPDPGPIRRIGEVRRQSKLA